MVNILDCRLGSSARTSTAAVMVTVRQRRPEKAVTRAGAGRGWGEEVSQTTRGGLWQSYYSQCLFRQGFKSHHNNKKKLKNTT